MTRMDILNRFRAEISAGRPVIGASGGTGLSAKTAGRGGADFVVIYNSGRYRMAGRGSLAGLMPYGDANEIVMDMGKDVLPIAGDLPIFAGVNGTDPFRVMPRFLAELKAAGFVGVQNFPTVGVFDGIFRENLEGTGMGYDLEVQMMRAAAELDLITMPYCFLPAEAEAMTADGRADIVVAHMGLTASGTVGATSVYPLDEAVARTQEIVDTARRIRPDVIALCHGGPIATPADWQYVLDRTEGVDGFLGASSMERLPAETAIRDIVDDFKQVRAQDRQPAAGPSTNHADQ